MALSAISVVNICAWVLAVVVPVRRDSSDPARAVR
jgi:hypothetical protein